MNSEPDRFCMATGRALGAGKPCLTCAHEHRKVLADKTFVAIPLRHIQIGCPRIVDHVGRPAFTKTFYEHNPKPESERLRQAANDD
jgi:hypothetical protein